MVQKNAACHLHLSMPVVDTFVGLWEFVTGAAD